VAPVTITPYRDGPLLVRGPVTLQGPGGRPIPVRRRTIALCRCGRTGTAPLCDGSHRPAGFRAAAGLEGR
jgi:CDGSH-type Zn-finger protein